MGKAERKEMRKESTMTISTPPLAADMAQKEKKEKGRKKERKESKGSKE
jgi:hypothetical protein